MNIVSTDQLSGPKPREEFRCRCGAQPTLVRKMMDPRNGMTVRMFECQCGERRLDRAQRVSRTQPVAFCLVAMRATACFETFPGADAFYCG
jgi:hypothetical protein